MILFSILYCPDLTYEQAAELSAHFLYSLRLTPTMHERLQQLGAEAVASVAPGFYNVPKVEDGPLASIVSGLGKRKRGVEPLRFYATMPVLGGAIEQLHQAISAHGMTISEAEVEMRKITLGRKTRDIVDHSWAYLQPHHRMSLYQFRESGMLRPFGVNVDNFTKLNKSGSFSSLPRGHRELNEIIKTFVQDDVYKRGTLFTSPPCQSRAGAGYGRPLGMRLSIRSTRK